MKGYGIKLGLMSLITTALLMSGCSSPGYVCPLKAQPGGCASQMQAYKATLAGNSDGVSIFSKQNKKD